MNEWTSGYVTEINYTCGYYSELNPLRSRLALLSAGINCPQIHTACELGFGQGMSINMHAAASLVEWHGTDFNASQVCHAQEVARACSNGANLYDEAFAEFSSRSSLPDFDFIGLHGIWSWVSEDNRKVIVDFVRRKLKVGGILYISYNTMPGWAAFAPMRHLLVEHSEKMGAQGEGIVGKIDRSLEFFESLLAVNPRFAGQLPQIGPKIAQIKSLSRNYLAHEYFNSSWQPMYFSGMASCLKTAKLDYACSARYLDLVDGFNFTQAQQDFLNSLSGGVLRQGVRDYMVNQAFRKDYWVKGGGRLQPSQQAEELGKERVVLQTARDLVPLTVKGGLGDISLSKAVYEPVLDLLADHTPRTISQIEQEVGARGISFIQVVEAMKVLVGLGHLAPVQEESKSAMVSKKAGRLNAWLIDRARYDGECGWLASPVSGGGIAVDRLEKLFLTAIKGGMKQPAEWAAYAWDRLALENLKLVKQGAVIELPEDNLAELTAVASRFEKYRRPILRALQAA